MKSIGLVRACVVAALCVAGGLVASQSASALTLTPGESALGDFQFTSVNAAYSSIVLDYGAFGSSSASLSLNFSDPSINTAFELSGNSGSRTINLAGPSSSDLLHVSFKYKDDANPLSAYDLETLRLSAYDANGTRVAGPVADAAAATPIPASLPLFLTAGILMFVMIRRRRMTGLLWQAA